MAGFHDALIRGVVRPFGMASQRPTSVERVFLSHQRKSNYFGEEGGPPYDLGWTLAKFKNKKIRLAKIAKLCRTKWRARGGMGKPTTFVV